MPRLPKTAALALQASIVIGFLAGSTAPTPLYGVYQAAWGFSPITVTAVYGIYALAVLGMLLVFGSLSDYVGRRPVLLAATVLQAVTMVLFATAHGVSDLVVARIVQGIATGGSAAAVGAGMIDVDRERGTLVNSVAPMLGTGLGGLLSGLLVQYLPRPTQLVYAVLGVLFVAQAIGVLFLRESVTPQPGALASLRPHFAIPPPLRRAFFVAVPALVSAWAIAGFYGSLGPMLVRHLALGSSRALGGLALFVLAGSGATAVLLMRARSARSVMLSGTGGIVAGQLVTLCALYTHSAGAFFVATVLSGAGFGCAFQGSIRTVLALAAPHQRAGVLSVLYLVAYLAMGVPAMLAGVGVVYGGGFVATTQQYAGFALVLAAVAFVGTWQEQPARRLTAD